MRANFLQIFMVMGACALLAACSSAPECPTFETSGKTLAPKKATSRPYQIKGVWYYPQPYFEYEEEGVASFYGGGDVFHGRPTATGEIFDKNGLTGAHKTLPLPCMAEVTNLENGRQIQIKINDRGPFPPGRLLDVSRRTAQLLGFEGKGLAKVKIRTLVPESLALNGIDPSTVMLAEVASPPVETLSIPERGAPIVVAALPTLPAEIFEEKEDKLVVAEAPSLPPPPASSPPPSPSKPEAPPSTGIFVDVGAHQTLDEAKMLSQQLNQFSDSPKQAVKNQGPKPYVVRLGPLPSMSIANQVLDQLTGAGHLMSRIVIHR